MGAKPRKRAGPLEFGPGFANVETLSSNQRFAFIENCESEPKTSDDHGEAWGGSVRTRVVISSADRDSQLRVPVQAWQLRWAPDTASLYSVDTQLHRIDSRSGAVTQLTDFGEWDLVRQMYMAPDGSTLAFLHEQRTGPDRIEDGVFVKAPSVQRVCLFNTKTMELTTLNCVKNPRLLYPCWHDQRAAVRVQGKTVVVVDLISDTVLETTSSTSDWRSTPTTCPNRGCPYHRQVPLTSKQRSLLGRPAFPMQRRGERLAFISNDSELRIADYDQLGDSRLIVSVARTQYAIEDGRRGGHGQLSWSKDGRLLAGTLAAWRKKERLSKEDHELVDRTLRANGLSRDMFTAEQGSNGARCTRTSTASRRLAIGSWSTSNAKKSPWHLAAGASASLHPSTI